MTELRVFGIVLGCILLLIGSDVIGTVLGGQDLGVGIGLVVVGCLVVVLAVFGRDWRE